MTTPFERNTPHNTEPEVIRLGSTIRPLLNAEFRILRPEEIRDVTRSKDPTSICHSEIALATGSSRPIPIQFDLDIAGTKVIEEAFKSANVKAGATKTIFEDRKVIRERHEVEYVEVPLNFLGLASSFDPTGENSEFSETPLLLRITYSPRTNSIDSKFLEEHGLNIQIGNRNYSSQYEEPKKYSYDVGGKTALKDYYLWNKYTVPGDGRTVLLPYVPEVVNYIFVTPYEK